MKKFADQQQANSALMAAWERFAAKMDRIRKSVISVLQGVDQRRSAKEADELRKRIQDL